MHYLGRLLSYLWIGGSLQNYAGAVFRINTARGRRNGLSDWRHKHETSRLISVIGGDSRSPVFYARHSITRLRGAFDSIYTFPNCWAVSGGENHLVIPGFIVLCPLWIRRESMRQKTMLERDCRESKILKTFSRGKARVCKQILLDKHRIGRVGTKWNHNSPEMCRSVCFSWSRVQSNISIVYHNDDVYFLQVSAGNLENCGA